MKIRGEKRREERSELERREVRKGREKITRYESGEIEEDGGKEWKTGTKAKTRVVKERE